MYILVVLEVAILTTSPFDDKVIQNSTSLVDIDISLFLNKTDQEVVDWFRSQLDTQPFVTLFEPVSSALSITPKEELVEIKTTVWFYYLNEDDMKKYKKIMSENSALLSVFLYNKEHFFLIKSLS